MLVAVFIKQYVLNWFFALDISYLHLNNRQFVWSILFYLPIHLLKKFLIRLFFALSTKMSPRLISRSGQSLQGTEDTAVELRVCHVINNMTYF